MLTPSFFQGFCLKANANPSVMSFIGPTPFFGVVRDAARGTPLTPAPLAATSVPPQWQLDLAASLAAAKDRAAVLYLFTLQADAAAYRARCRTWTADEKALVDAGTIPDVELPPQQALAQAIAQFPPGAVGPARQTAWATLNKQAVAIYSTFVPNPPGITPILSDRPGAPVIICAPGNPPPWMPPP